MKRADKEERINDVIEQFILAEEIVMTENQTQILNNHLSEMHKRSIVNEAVTGLDKSSFSEISENAITIATKIVDLIGNLNKDEILLLSVHFETMLWGKKNGNE